MSLLVILGVLNASGIIRTILKNSQLYKETGIIFEKMC
ncbi:hypothetical protein CHCC20348_4379 [Bacillus paralicheniformis]|nr:hypothetical protein CHCC20348_4379 [Bacillus paralicheniformis]